MADIDNLTIKITANVSPATKALNNLAKAIEKVNDALGKLDTSKLSAFSNATQGFTQKVSDLKGASKAFESVNKSVSKAASSADKLTKMGDSASGASKRLEALKIESNTVGGAMESAGKSAENFATSNARVKNAMKALNTGFQGFSSTLKKVGSFFKTIASRSMQAASGIRLFGKNSGSSKKTASALFKELTRIAKMLKLMITRMVLRKVIQGVIDGFKNLVQYSKTFDASISLLWNDFRQLGNSIAAATSPLINAFAPAIHYIIQLAIQAVNAINQLLSALTGLSSWTRAKTLTDSYADSLKKAGGAAKELKKTVLGFDELNQLQDNKNSGGGGTSPANMFEDLPIDDKWKDWAARLKDMWAKADFTELGKTIGKKILDALNKIPWSKYKAKAYKIGKSLATFINGLVETPTLGYTIGKSIAEAFNTAIMLANGWVRNLHWDSIGKFVGETFNGFFKNIDWFYIKDTVVAGFRGLAISIQNAIDTFDWDNISKTVINALDTISAGLKAFFEKIEWGDLGEKFGTQLAKIISDTDWRQVGEAIGDIIQAAIDFVSNTLSQLNWADIKQAIQDLLGGLFEKTDKETLGGIIGVVLGGALAIGAGKVILTAATSALSSQLAGWIAGAFGAKAVETAASTAMGETIAGAAGAETVTTAATTAGTTIGGLITGGIAAGMGAAIGFAVAEPIKRNLFNIGEWIAEAVDNDKAAEKIRNMHEAYNQMGGSLNLVKDGFKEFYELLGGEVDRSIYTLTDDLGNTKRTVDDLGNTIIEFVDHSDSLKSSVGNLGISVKRDMGTFSSSTQKSMDVVTKSTNAMKDQVVINFESVDNAVANTNTFLSGQEHQITLGVNDMASDITSTTDKLKDSFSEDKWTFSGVIDGFKKTFEGVKSAIAPIWNSIANKLNGNHNVGGSFMGIHLPTFATGGFPEDGLFMANHGEMVGRFSNGRTAVANNEQITDGIARAVFNAMVSASASGGNDKYINNTIVVDGVAIARAVTKGQETLDRRYSPTMA